jgi:hypothetical protein
MYWSHLEEAVKSILSPAFNLQYLRFRDTRRETRRYQGGPHNLGRPGTFKFLSLCLSEGDAGVFPEDSSVTQQTYTKHIIDIIFTVTYEIKWNHILYSLVDL